MAHKKSIIGMEYVLFPDSQRRALLCVLYEERARRLEAGEKKSAVDILFRAAYERLKENTLHLCAHCLAELGMEHFLQDPFGLTCSDKCHTLFERQKLVERKNELRKELDDLTRETKAFLREESSLCVISNHLGDQNHQPNIDLNSRIPTLKKLIAQFEEAIKMHLDGTYGICEECEEPIDPERLKVAPNANRCVECKTEIEERNKVPNGFGRKVPLSHIGRHIIV